MWKGEFLIWGGNHVQDEWRYAELRQMTTPTGKIGRSASDEKLHMASPYDDAPDFPVFRELCWNAKPPLAFLWYEFPVNIGKAWMDFGVGSFVLQGIASVSAVQLTKDPVY